MNETEILKVLNDLGADALERVIVRAGIILEKKKKEEAEQAALLEKERLRQEKLAEEKRRQEEIAMLQKKLNELQRQSVAVKKETDPVQGDNFVMYETAPAKPQAAKTIACPHCRQANPAGSQFCSNCGKKISSAPAAPPSPAAAKTVACPHCGHTNPAGSQFCADCGQRMSAPVPQRTAPASAPRQSSGANGQLRYADASMDAWVRLPGEKTELKDQEVHILQPAQDKKFRYYMEITNKRVLFTRMGAVAASADAAFGLIGSLVRNAAGAGPKPWLEIPLTAITNCGERDKKEFFIDAGESFVLKNKHFERVLPALVMKAKQG